MNRRAAVPVAGALLCVLLFALGWRLLRPPPEADFDPQRLVRHEILAMGTRISVTLYRRDGHSPAQAEAAIADVERQLRSFGRDWWAWGDGALGAINRELAAGHQVSIPATMQPLFGRAAEINRITGGLFEPRIGALVRLWGFDDVARLRDRPPEPADIALATAALHGAPAYAGGDRYGPAPGISWDFGAIAKGYVVDHALDLLAQAGFRDAVVDAGGNLAVRGRKGDQPWHIAIRHPRAENSQPFLATLDAEDEAVNTHGDYERHIDYQGHRYGHILNPTTGYPAASLISVTVVNADGTLADAEGAALFVAGVDGWQALARKLRLDEVLVVDSDGHVLATPALAQKLQTEPGIQLQIVR
jgi:thiamine biosynthesis lipoprotein